MNHRFYKTTITLEILSEDPIPADAEIAGVWERALHGPHVGREKRRVERLNGAAMRDELTDFGREPEYFTDEE